MTTKLRFSGQRSDTCSGNLLKKMLFPRIKINIFNPFLHATATPFRRKGTSFRPSFESRKQTFDFTAERKCIIIQKRRYKSEKRVINNQKHRISLPFLLFFALETWRSGVKKTGVCFHKVGTCSNQLPIFFLPPPFSALPKPRFIPQKRPLRFYLLRKSVQKPFIHFKTNGSPSASFVMIYSQLLPPPPSHSPPRRPRSPQNPYSSLKIR